MYLVGYAAGLLDGEGCVQIQTWNTSRYYCRLAVTVGMGNPAGIEALQAVWEGAIIETQTQSGKPYYRWQVVANQALKFLRDVLPHVLTKREEVELAIEFQENRGYRLRRAANRKERDQEFKSRLMALHHL